MFTVVDKGMAGNAGAILPPNVWTGMVAEGDPQVAGVAGEEVVGSVIARPCLVLAVVTGGVSPIVDRLCRRKSRRVCKIIWEDVVVGGHVEVGVVLSHMNSAIFHKC
jgi:hypothetical protein